MCRNIRTLHNFEPPATHDEVAAAALQYVRKVSGSTKPSAANQEAFDRAVEQVTAVTHELLDSLVTNPLTQIGKVPAPRRTCADPGSECRERGSSQYGLRCQDMKNHQPEARPSGASSGGVGEVTPIRR